MENTATMTICGTCGIFSKIGGYDPFYAYRIETTVHQSDFLNVRKEIRTLHLLSQHNGPSEIGSLFLSAAHRGGGNGRLLSLSRFLFMADHLAYFDPVDIAEMRGVFDNQGRSPFWDAIGHHFFDIDFPKADYLSMVNKRFIADLMPKHPIYIPLLPKTAQDVIGEVHEHTRPALKILQDEGFTLAGLVDIFEGGPNVQCSLREIRAIRESKRATITHIVQHKLESEPYLVSNAAHDFRCAHGAITISDGGVTLQHDMAAALNVQAGQAIRYVPLKPTHRTAERYHDANISFD
jgi:arginine N-succinyltransferase